jgi:hypothetical protein
MAASSCQSVVVDGNSVRTRTPSRLRSGMPAGGRLWSHPASFPTGTTQTLRISRGSPNCSARRPDRAITTVTLT